MKLLKNLFKGKPAYKVISSEKSIQLYKGETVKREVFWKDVERIRVYKKDLFTYDCIYLAFDLNNSSTFEIDEELEGFKETMGILPGVFKDIDEEWFFDVAFPAFETNMKTVWTRS